MLGEKTKTNKLEERLATDSLLLSLQPVSSYSASMPSLDDIVRAQLETQKEYNRDLEKDRDQWKKSCAQERIRADMLHKDNVGLLEKLQYANSYSGREKQSEDLENRYNMDPFESFKSARKVIGPERFMIAFAGFLLSVRTTRVALVLYLGSLHCAVYFSVTRMTMCA